MPVATKQRKQRTCDNPACNVKFAPALGKKVCSWACSQAIAPAGKANKQDKPRQALTQRKPLTARKPMPQRKPMPPRKPLVQRERREIEPGKKKVKARADHIAEAQALFNELIRLRDAGRPCISCGKTDAEVTNQVPGGWDCGHFRTVGACPELRFEPLNCARQCQHCNRNLSGNVAGYRIGLVQRIGADKLAWLDGPHPARKYTIDDLKAIKAECRVKIKALKGSAA